MIELFVSEYRIIAQDVLAFALCGAALIWGGGPERAVAVTWLVLFQLGTFVHGALFEGSFRLVGVDGFLASMDLLAAISFVGIALYANRNYTLWIAGVQLLALTAHFARGFTEMISPIAYAIMVIAPGWFQLLFLAIGLARHVLRTRRHGPYRGWRNAGPGRTANAATPLLEPLASLFGTPPPAPRNERR